MGDGSKKQLGKVSKKKNAVTSAHLLEERSLLISLFLLKKQKMPKE